MSHMPRETRKVIFLLALFNFLLWAALGVLSPIEVLFLDQLTDSATVKGMILGITSLVILVFSPYAIRVSDKYGRRRVMIILIMVSGLSFAFLPLASNIYVYGALKAVSSLLFLCTPIAFAYISDTVKRLGLGYGSIIFASSVGGCVGAFVSGFAVLMFGFHVSYLFVTFLAFVSVLVIMPLSEVWGFRKTEVVKVRKWDFLLVAVFVNSFVFSLHMSARGVFVPLLLMRISDAPSVYSGLIFSLMGLTAAILSLPSGLLSERMGERKVFFFGWMVMGVMGVLMFFVARSIYLFLVVSVLYAVGEILRGPSSSMILARYKDSVYFGYAASVGALGGVIGAVVAGVMVDVFDVYMAVLIVGAVVFVMFVPVFLMYLYREKVNS